MPNPTARALHIDALLTDFAIGYGTDIASTYVSSRAATLKRHSKKSDKYGVWNKGDFYRSDMQLRADGTRAVRSGQRWSTEDFNCKRYALGTELTDEQRENSDIDIEASKVRYLVNQAHLKRDALFASTFFTSGVWSGFSDQTGVASGATTNQFVHWSDYTNGDPIGDIQKKVLALGVEGGVPDTRLVGVCNDKVFQRIQNHPDLLDRIKYTGGETRPSIITPQAMAAIMGIDELIIAKAVQNTAAETQAVSMSRVFDDNFMLAYVSESPALDVPTAMTTFAWSPFDMVTADSAAIFSYYENDIRATIMEAEQYFTHVVTATDLAGIFLSCVA